MTHTPDMGSTVTAGELLSGDERVVYRTSEPRRARSAVAMPVAVSERVRELFAATGVTSLYRFQGEAIQLVRAGSHVVLAGGTGSGKSLCYQLPLLEALAERHSVTDRKQTALYLAPTKSLAQDQARRLRELAAPWAQPRLYDGDTPRDLRARIRASANLLLTNPDMLSAGILPSHVEWATFLKGLAIVVIDESHVYRG
ncbi:MAG: DEAD/DEAH box helicase, partial [Gaiellales bacterium]